MSYGEWISPISLDIASSPRNAEISNAVLDPVSGKLYWRVKKPSGQFVICTGDHEDDACEWTPPEFSVVSRVHEYGGGEYFAYNDELYFVNKTDQRIYRQTTSTAHPVPVTAEYGDGMLRYANGHFNKFLNKIVIVREDHRIKDKECVNTIVAIDLKSGEQTVLCSGADFYKGVHTYEDKIVFISWNHPNMPWDVTQLNIGDLKKGEEGEVSVENVSCLQTDSSILQPQLVTRNIYFYLSDKHDYWNVWKSGVDNKAWYESKKESGWPYGWIFGSPGYGILENGIVIGAKDSLLLVDLGNPQVVKKDLSEITRKHGYAFGTFANILCHKNLVYVLGMDDSAHTTALLRISVEDDSLLVYNNSSAEENLKPYISYPEAICFPTTEEGNAYGYLYKPKNPDYSSDVNKRPPLLVRIHGGPTGLTRRSLNMKTQYYTSRGFAVFDVDYRGSTGYGRSYRRALYGKWGIYDIEDAISAARFLIKQDIVDKDQLAIDGGSAGGYTTMAMMVFKDVFQAAVSYFGVSDLLGLAKFTHKFESRYLDQMIGKLPEAEDVYKARSPLYHANQLTGAIGFFQGSDDFVCPPAQSKELYQAALDNNIPTFYIEFEGEAHGFKKATTIKRCISNEIHFYSKMFGFHLADKTENPPLITNLLEKD